MAERRQPMMEDPRNFLSTKEGRRFLQATKAPGELTFKELDFATEFLERFLILTHSKDPRSICSYQEAQLHILQCDLCQAQFRVIFSCFKS